MVEKIKVGLLSKQGGREYNEDYIDYVIMDNCACFAVADGLGGHGKGDIAAKCVVDTIISDYKNKKEEFNFREALSEAQTKLVYLQKSNNNMHSFKTTIVSVWISEKYIQWGHVGDSRLYFWKYKRIRKQTLDHSVPQMLLNAKKIKKKDIRFHESRNRLLRAMGSMNCEPDISNKIKYKKAQAFLLCTDGFWEYIDEKQMRKAYKISKTPQMWLENMEEIISINAKGRDQDNYSAIAIWM